MTTRKGQATVRVQGKPIFITGYYTILIIEEMVDYKGQAPVAQGKPIIQRKMKN